MAALWHHRWRYVNAILVPPLFGMNSAARGDMGGRNDRLHRSADDRGARVRGGGMARGERGGARCCRPFLWLFFALDLAFVVESLDAQLPSAPRIAREYDR
jgi:hypothetical protein